MRLDDSELEDAWKNLTDSQREMIQDERKHHLTISGIACKLGLTRSYVHSYISYLNTHQ